MKRMISGCVHYSLLLTQAGSNSIGFYAFRLKASKLITCWDEQDSTSTSELFPRLPASSAWQGFTLGYTSNNFFSCPSWLKMYVTHRNEIRFWSTYFAQELNVMQIPWAQKRNLGLCLQRIRISDRHRQGAYAKLQKPLGSSLYDSVLHFISAEQVIGERYNPGPQNRHLHC